MTARTTVIGLGSYYGQDELAWVVSDRLIERKQLDAIDVIKSMPVELPELLQKRQQVILMDACILPGESATIHVIDFNDLQNNRLALQSSHGLGVTEMLALCHSLGDIPESLQIIALTIDSNVEISTLLSDSYLTRIEKTINDLQASYPVSDNIS